MTNKIGNDELCEASFMTILVKEIVTNAEWLEYHKTDKEQMIHPKEEHAVGLNTTYAPFHLILAIENIENDLTQNIHTKNIIVH